jgi:hypothetical protein
MFLSPVSSEPSCPGVRPPVRVPSSSSVFVSSPGRSWNQNASSRFTFCTRVEMMSFSSIGSGQAKCQPGS